MLTSLSSSASPPSGRSVSAPDASASPAVVAAAGECGGGSPDKSGPPGVGAAIGWGGVARASLTGVAVASATAVTARADTLGRAPRPGGPAAQVARIAGGPMVDGGRSGGGGAGVTSAGFISRGTVPGVSEAAVAVLRTPTVPNTDLPP